MNEFSNQHPTTGEPNLECSTRSGVRHNLGGRLETSFKRLILRAVLRDVYPMVIRLVAVPDYLELATSMTFSMPSWVGMAESATRSRFTAKSSTAFAAERGPSDCAILVFITKKSFSTHWVRSINGSGKCG